MARPENPIDPASPFAGFAGDLRELRRTAGQPTYREMAKKVLFAPSSLAAAAAGQRMPTWEATRAYVAACDGDELEWRRRWEQARSSNGSGDTPVGTATVASGLVPSVLTIGRWSRLRWRAWVHRGGSASASTADLAVLDPLQARTPEQFVAAMWDLRTRTSHFSLRDLSVMARKKGHRLAPTTLHDALRSNRLPSRLVIEGFLAACEVSDPQPWLSAWQGLLGKSRPEPLPRVKVRLMYRPVIVIVLIVVALSLTLAAVLFVRSPYWSDGCGGLFPTKHRTSTGECLGVIDSPDALDEGLVDVIEKILEENRRVTSQTGQPYVKVVLLAPLSQPADSPLGTPLRQIRHSLEGAYTALYRANHSPDFGDPSKVGIQMFLANQGSTQAYSDGLIAEILDQSETGHPVVAVVGLGRSLRGTAATAEALAVKGIPMVSAVASADGLDAAHIPRLRSVSPSNADYTRALSDLLKHSSGIGKAGMIVADGNEDDLYTSSLRDAFDTVLSKYVKYPAQSFSGGTTESNRSFDAFDPIVQNICRASPDTVFFAGHSPDLLSFVRALDSRACSKEHLTILTAGNRASAIAQYRDFLNSANVALIYATATDASAWKEEVEVEDPAGFSPFLEQFDELGFDEASLADDYAIMYHDALASAASAIHLAAKTGVVPSPDSVDAQFDNLNLSHAVAGASGTLSYSASSEGRANGKVIICRQVGPRPLGLSTDIAAYVTK